MQYVAMPERSIKDRQRHQPINPDDDGTKRNWRNKRTYLCSPPCLRDSLQKSVSAIFCHLLAQSGVCKHCKGSTPRPKESTRVEGPARLVSSLPVQLLCSAALMLSCVLNNISRVVSGVLLPRPGAGRLCTTTHFCRDRVHHISMAIVAPPCRSRGSSLSSRLSNLFETMSGRLSNPHPRLTLGERRNIARTRVR
ncbi:hypothetical protein BV25DRAFT_524011 [Artomyces pyxidatus]|uniref:Uncharacterized protein n=1 Tax=Artomyces pyxidatus TaxID=48021 RepID=A0ACB8TI44_9AGAM|nr:hypothetical protein BV25DRAFT_524011 [Artomyces pyxidatus]